jgi:hydroxymethylbilane synthase
LGRTKQVVIGCRGDALSTLYLERVRAALKEAHPHADFIDVREAPGRGGSARQKTIVMPLGAAVSDPAWRGEAALKKADARRGAGGLIQKLAKGEIDVGVIDARWIPLQMPAPVEIAAVFERTNPFDVLIAEANLILDEQPESTCIASSEAVKRGQLLYYRSDLRLVEGDDDFESLFAEMKKGAINAFVFPASDVETLNQQGRVVEVFTTSICTPVAGQGALALLARRDKKDVLGYLKCFNDPSTASEIEVERMFLERVTKDGRGPVGVLCSVEENEFELEAAIAAPDGSEKISGAISGTLAERTRIIGKLAAELLTSGGEDIIASCRKMRGSC